MMSTTLAFKFGSVTYELTDTPELAIILASVKVGAHLTFMNESSYSEGVVTRVSASGTETDVTKTFSVTPARTPRKFEIPKEPPYIALEIDVEDKIHRITDAAMICSYASQNIFEFKGHQIINDEPRIVIANVPDQPLYVIYFIQNQLHRQPRHPGHCAMALDNQ